MGRRVRIRLTAPVDWSQNSSQAHTGIDLSAARGNRVFSVKQGVVYKVGSLGGKWGRYVVIFNRDGTSNGYLHVDPEVVEGARVQRGQEIGTIYRDHLHLNQCKSADGCQHGAFPNPTFPTGSKSDVGKYYVRYKM